MYYLVLSKIFSFLIVGILAGLFLFLPAFNNSMLIQATVTAKTILFINIILLLLSVFLLRLILVENPIFHVHISKIDISLSILVLFIIINRYFLQSQYGFSIRLIDLGGLCLLYLILRCTSLENLSWLFIAIIISGVVQSVYGILQLLGYFPSLNSGFAISGSFFNPGPYAGFLSIIWPISLGLYFFRDNIISIVISNKQKFKKSRHKLIRILFYNIPLIGMITLIIVIPSTRSRAAWLAVIISTTVLLANKYKVLEKLKELKIFQKGLLILIVIPILSIVLYGVYLFKKDSADGRMLIWKVTTRIIRNNPIFGVGYDRFNAYYMDAQADYFVQNKNPSEEMVADNSYYAFNEILQFLSENGFVGLLLLLMTFLFALRLTPSYEMEFLKQLSLTILLSIFVFGMFSYPLQILPIKSIGICSLATLANLDTKKFNLIFKQKFYSSNCNVVWVFKTIIVIVGISFIWITYFKMKNIEKGMYTWKNAMNLYNNGLYEDSVGEFEKTYRLFNKNGDYLMNYGKTLIMSDHPKKAIENLERAKNYLNTTIIETALGDAYKCIGHYSKAEEAYYKAVNMIPHRFYPHYLLAQLYEESGQKEKASDKARELLGKKVKIPSNAIIEIRAKMQMILNKRD